MSDPDPWAALRRFTPARIALGRAGAAQPTRELLDFALAHARARDAVHTAMDGDGVARAIEGLGYDSFGVHSAAGDRAIYLARPDLGRVLSGDSRAALAALPRADPDLAIVVADGLSAVAVERNAPPLLAALRPWIAAAGWRIAPVVVALQGRVALGDDIAACLAARLVLVLIGERPGLSAPDGLGAYLTFGPRPGITTDADRNCLSNIRPEGLQVERAAFQLAWLVGEALRRGLSGLELKDESDRLVVDGRLPEPARLARPS
jgi:ethanolamine ammonia-lyase small subunit